MLDFQSQAYFFEFHFFNLFYLSYIFTVFLEQNITSHEIFTFIIHEAEKVAVYITLNGYIDPLIHNVGHNEYTVH